VSALQPDAVVIPEPYPGFIPTAQVGVLWFHVDIAGTAHGDSTACNLCAACCVTGASPPARIEPPAMAASSAGFPPVIAVAADFLAHGLERPPRLA
jgi:hypothetical protein